MYAYKIVCVRKISGAHNNRSSLGTIINSDLFRQRAVFADSRRPHCKSPELITSVWKVWPRVWLAQRPQIHPPRVLLLSASVVLLYYFLFCCLLSNTYKHVSPYNYIHQTIVFVSFIPFIPIVFLAPFNVIGPTSCRACILGDFFADAIERIEISFSTNMESRKCYTCKSWYV